MEQVISILKKLFQDISSTINISTDLLLYISLGVLVLLLIIIMIAKKRPPKEKKIKKVKEQGQKKNTGFWEVGPEPVIVYGRDKKKEEAQPEEELELRLDLNPTPSAEPQPLPEPEPQPAPKFDFTPEPEPQSSEFSFIPKPEIPPEPKFEFTPGIAPQAQPDLPPEPEPLPVSTPKPAFINLSQPTTYSSPFQQYMNAEPGKEEVAATFKPTLTQDPLPQLESDFASEILLLFSKQGFTIEKVVYHGTYGADFIVTTKGVKTYVQVKDWKKKATPRTVQEARYYSNTNNCHNTILVPLAGYTSAATREAGQRAVLLWNAKTIKKLRNGENTLEELIAASSF
jgi:hypothetical protein